ncbi:MAG TPA: histidine kinase dimerization/phospho-acceptor domain-containing protein, partial [Planctomycetia bacterium]|nr:histidine kinase dimerization/phospho-acceptor domain-containing protein [Planctomycetia bacterium]
MARSLRRLLGESSLERKVRLVLGGGLFGLILLSFFLFGLQTERLVWDQTRRTGEMLANYVFQERHWLAIPRVNKGGFATLLSRIAEPVVGAEDSLAVQLQSTRLWPSFRKVAAAGAFGPLIAELAQAPADNADRRFTFEDLRAFLVEGDSDQAPREITQYRSRFFRNLPPDRNPPEYKPATDWHEDAMEKLVKRRAGQQPEHEWGRDEKGEEFNFMRAVRIKASCLRCHPTPMERNRLKIQSYSEGEVMGAIGLAFSLTDTEVRLNVNRAILISFAIGTALLAMFFVYAAVRYVIVRPITHLKNVSDEIAEGNLSTRSDIKTGDEFQQLSHAFNRMIRSLVAMQDELRRVNHDLDERLDDLAKANMSLYELNRLKSEFLATISHELRTPLNSILGFSDLLSDTEGIPDKKRRWVTNIQNSGKILLGLINDILDLAKLEAGKMQVQLEDFSIRDLVEGQVAMLRPLADQKNIALAVEIDSDLPILHQDSKKLGQIINNFLSNAVKFTPEGGRIAIRVKQDRAHFLLSVEDNGVGIAPEDQKIVFEKFRQAQSGLTRHHGGTG